MSTLRSLVFTFVAMLGTASLLDAQYIRISNAGIIPNSGVVPPTIMKSTLALYTDDARAHGIEGTVTIEALIDEGGQIRSSRVFKSLGFGLDEVTLASVQSGNSVRQHETVLRFRSSLKLMCSSICGVPMRYAWAALQILDQQFCREWNHGIRRKLAWRS